MRIEKNPNVWGPPLWDILHFLTFKYNSKEDKELYLKLFSEYVLTLIPCPPCERHYERRLVKIPIDLRSREKLSRWLVNLHNDVNKELKKPTMSYEKVVERYKKNESNRKRIMKSFITYNNISRGYVTANSQVQKANSNLIRIVMKHL
tara:strand:- start:1185 stop:1628 length:444 start_codon:yes stop_codon:yes gene_type:complete